MAINDKENQIDLLPGPEGTYMTRDALGVNRADVINVGPSPGENLTPYVSPGPSANPLIQEYKDRQMARMMGSQDITGRMPLGERIRMLTSGGEAPMPVPPLYPEMGTGAGPAGAAPKTRDLASEMLSAVNPETGVLPWDFWARRPGAAGGVMTIMEGPNKGKTFTLVEPSPAENLKSKIDSLMGQWIDKVSSAIGQGASSATIETLLRQMPNMMNAQTGAATAPSIIQKNISEATRPQVIPNVYTGEPGNVASYVVPAGGGEPKAFTKGAHESRMALAPETMMATLVPKIAEKFLESAFDVTQPPEQQQKALEGFVKMMQFAENYRNKGNQAASAAPGAVDWANYYREAKRLNPTATDDQIRSAYQKRFGGQK